MKPYWMDEFERMTRMLRDMAESPAVRFMRDFEKQRQLLEPPGYRALLEWQESIAKSQRINESLLSGFSTVVGQYDLLKSISKSEAYTKNLVTDFQRSLRAFQSPALPLVESFTAELLGASRNLTAMVEFEKTFAAQLLERAREVAEAPAADVEERVENLTNFIGGQIAQSKRGPVSLEGWVQIILALILYFQAAASSQKTEDRLAARMEAIEEKLKAVAPPQVQVENVPELRLVTASALKVRSAAAADAEIVGKLTQNALVRQIEVHKSWARVEYFDYVAGQTKEGWVSKQHLQPLPADLMQ